MSFAVTFQGMFALFPVVVQPDFVIFTSVTDNVEPQRNFFSPGSFQNIPVHTLLIADHYQITGISWPLKLPFSVKIEHSRFPQIVYITHIIDSILLNFSKLGSFIMADAYN